MKVVKEMGISHADFFSILPRVMQDRAYDIDGFNILHEDTDKRISIRLSAEKQRKIASITLPVTSVEIELQGYSRTDAEKFLHVFDLKYQRGGG